MHSIKRAGLMGEKEDRLRADAMTSVYGGGKIECCH